MINASLLGVASAARAAVPMALEAQEREKRNNPQNRSVNYDTASKRIRGLSSKQRSILEVLGLLIADRGIM